MGAVAKQGYVFDAKAPPDAQAGVFSFEAAGGGTEYWVGYHNFSVITRYNRSAKYALAAHQLGQAIRAEYLAAAGAPLEGSLRGGANPPGSKAE